MKVYSRLSAAFAITVIVASLPFSSGCSKEDTLAAEIALGHHLVNEVAMCQDCHSPRLADGSFDPERTLLGAPLAFAPTVEMPWAPAAPMIAGLPTLNDEEAIAFFTTGMLPDNRQVRPPMPHYRFSPVEARAVTAYLRSLKRS